MTASPAVTVERSPLTAAELLRASTIAPGSTASFSPDGRQIAYVVTDNSRKEESVPDTCNAAGVAWSGLDADVWITDLETGRAQCITGGIGHNWAPSWSPDGSEVAFLADRSGLPALGPAHVWIWERESAELRQVGTQRVRGLNVGITWVLEGRAVVVATFPQTPPEVCETARRKGSAGSPVTVRVFDSSAEAAPDLTDLAAQARAVRHQDLTLIDAATGAPRHLTNGQHVMHPTVSRDGRLLAYAALGSADPVGSLNFRSALHVIDLETGEDRCLVRDQFLSIAERAFNWSPAGDRIAFRTRGPSGPDEVHVVDVRSQRVQLVAEVPATEEFGRGSGPPVWDVNTGRLIFVQSASVWCAPGDEGIAQVVATTRRHTLRLIQSPVGAAFCPFGGPSLVVQTTEGATKRQGMARIDLDTQEFALIYEEDKRYGTYGTAPGVSPDGRSLVYVAEDPGSPPDFVLRTGDLTSARRLTDIAPELNGRRYSQAQMLEWRSLDGELHRGALLHPEPYDSAETYPLIVNVYGGNSLSGYINAFGYCRSPFENTHLLTTRGFAVLLADSTVGVGTPVQDLMKTVMPGIQRAIETGVADPERVGITGHSYGAYSTFALISQSKIFKAAVARAGIADLLSMYGHLGEDGSNFGVTWAESGQGRMGGTPWEYPNRYIENSPIFDFDRCEAAVLIIHGTKDQAVPSFLSDQAFTALRRLGKTVRYLRYDGEDHAEPVWSRANQFDVLERVSAWWDVHLKGGPLADTADREPRGGSS